MYMYVCRYVNLGTGYVIMTSGKVELQDVYLLWPKYIGDLTWADGAYGHRIHLSVL